MVVLALATLSLWIAAVAAAQLAALVELLVVVGFAAKYAVGKRHT